MDDQANASGSQTKLLIDELIGTKCRCGNTKRTRNTFCGRCYFRLPMQLRNDLYKGVGNGYEQAYAAAISILQGAKP